MLNRSLNNKSLIAAFNEVFDDFLQMPTEDFHKLLEDSELGDIGSLLYETNSIESMYNSKSTNYLTTMPPIAKVFSIVNKPYTNSSTNKNEFISNSSDNYEEFQWPKVA